MTLTLSNFNFGPATTPNFFMYYKVSNLLEKYRITICKRHVTMFKVKVPNWILVNISNWPCVFTPHEGFFFVISHLLQTVLSRQRTLQKSHMLPGLQSVKGRAEQRLKLNLKLHFGFWEEVGNRRLVLNFTQTPILVVTFTTLWNLYRGEEGQREGFYTNFGHKHIWNILSSFRIYLQSERRGKELLRLLEEAGFVFKSWTTRDLGKPTVQLVTTMNTN